MDFFSRWMAKILYPLGISTDPQQVVIGYDGWLYLGDKHESTLTVDRQLASEAEFRLGKEIRNSIDAWDAYLAAKGVQNFKVMIGPNKGSIYSENLPNWAKPSSSNATDALVRGSQKYIDLRTPLLEEKSQQKTALYYKTDTHWNSMGAGIAFQYFAQQVSLNSPDLKWPSPVAYQLLRVDHAAGGDLANFLRLKSSLSDQEPIINFSSLPVDTIQTDFDTKQVIHQGGNPAVISPPKPVLVQSVGALNNKKVLWLRDSFGTALSPLMAATFSDVLQLHWGEAIKPGGRLLQLLENWKPDYVFFTVVERSARSPWFAAYPPPLVSPKNDEFKITHSTHVVGTNHLSSTSKQSEFQITGNDSFFDIEISNGISPAEAMQINIELICEDKTDSVPIQLFWLENGKSHYDEEHSFKLLFKTGNNTINLRTVQKFMPTESIKRIRLDIDAVNYCNTFKLTPPVFGSSSIELKN